MRDELHALREDLSQRLGCDTDGWSPVRGGTQNRLFRVEVEDGAPLLVKVYHRDRWNRLEREFSVVWALGQAGVQRVPRAIFKNDDLNYGVYSFEPGSARQADELQKDDLLEVASFVADVSRVSHESMSVELAPAVDSAFTLRQQLQVIDSRLRAYERFARSEQAYAEVRELSHELDLRIELAQAVARIADGLSGAQRETPIPVQCWRVNSGDFGPQNFLFTDDGHLTVVDFESGGWDDPARLVMGFVAHATTESLAPEAAETFLAACAAACDISDSEVTRMERVGTLLDVEWVAIYASALIPEIVAAKEFADSGFERHAYLQGAIGRLRRRLARVKEGVGYRFAR